MEYEDLKYEAARFALLSRISGSLRHKFVGRIQPIGFAASLAGKQIQNQNFKAAIENIEKLQNLVKQATQSAISVLAWLTEEEPHAVSFKEGIDACIDLIRTDCEMRGMKIESCDLHEKITVQRRTLRTFVVIILLAIIDNSEEAIQVRITSEIVSDLVILNFNVSSLRSREHAVVDRLERRIHWTDVDALAHREKMAVTKNSEAAVKQYKLSLRILGVPLNDPY